MLQFHIELCCIENNVAHLSAYEHAQAGKVQRYIKLFVASRRASWSWSPTFWGILSENPCGQYEQEQSSPPRTLGGCSKFQIGYYTPQARREGEQG